MSTSEPVQPAVSKKRQGRSPSYPAIDLEFALDRARVLLKNEGKNRAPVSAILHHWGYGPRSGGGAASLAALKKFGLLMDEGSGESRQAWLTDLALDILMDAREDSPERAQRIREAALTPRIHAELWQEYNGDLPSDTTLKFKLMRERGFTESGASEFISELHRTATFAGLSAGDATTNTVGASFAAPDATTNMTAVAPPATPTTAGLQAVVQPVSMGHTAGRSVQLPLTGTEWATLTGAFPMSEAAWEQMLRVLSVMKPALVEDGVTAASPPSASSDTDDEPTHRDR